MTIKVDVYSVMRNEIKILPYFLRHYETFADRIFVWDEGSDDGTREMLELHPKVKILPSKPFSGQPDDLYWCEELWPQYRIYSRGYADWVICADADEFVYHPNILTKLEELRSNGTEKVRCSGFVMYHPDFPKTQGQIYDEVKLGYFDAKTSSKTILFNPTIEIRWGIGRHHCNREKFSVVDTGIIILHFRLLGYDDYIEKSKKKNLRTKYNRRRTRISLEEFEKDMSDTSFARIVE